MGTQRTNRLTVVILAQNEADNLKELLPQLKTWVSNILVVDDESTDQTIKISRARRVRVLKHQLNDDYAKARNWALAKVTTPWTLFLDADERIPPATAKAIVKAINRPGKHQAFRIPRRDILKGKQLRHGETAAISLVRLGRTKVGQWRRSVHEVWEFRRVGDIDEPILHYSHMSWRSSSQKIRRYARMEAEYRQAQQQEQRLVEWSYPILKFIDAYLLKRGFLDGSPGFFMAWLMSYHSLLVRWYQAQQQLYRFAAQPRITKGLQVFVLAAIGLVPLGQLTRLQLSSTVAIYPFEVLMAASIGLWIFQCLWRKRIPQTPSYFFWVLVFTAVLGISLLNNAADLGTGLAGASLYWWRWLLYVLFGWVLWDTTVIGLLRISATRLLGYIGGGLLLGGWLQYLFMPDMRWLYAYGWDDHYYRMIGALYDPNYLGLLLVLTLLLVLHAKYAWSGLVVLVNLLGLVLTYSRSSYLTFGVIMPVWIVATRRIKTGILVLMFFGLSLAAISSIIRPGGEGVNLTRTYSITHRARSVVTGWDIFSQHPWWGIGFNAYRLYTQQDLEVSDIPHHPSSPDSSWVLILATSGLAGLSTFLLMIGSILKAASRKPLVLTSLVAILIHAFTNNSFFYPWVMIWWWLVCLTLVPKPKTASEDSSQKK